MPAEHGNPVAALVMVIEAFALGATLIGPAAIPRLAALVVRFVVFKAAVVATSIRKWLEKAPPPSIAPDAKIPAEEPEPA